jgi:hypothetical protein
MGIEIIFAIGLANCLAISSWLMGADEADLDASAVSTRAAISAAKQGLTKASAKQKIAVVFIRIMEANSSRLTILLTTLSMPLQSIGLFATLKG